MMQQHSSSAKLLERDMTSCSLPKKMLASYVEVYQDAVLNPQTSE